jgi:hypothetical protein
MIAFLNSLVITSYLCPVKILSSKIHKLFSIKLSIRKIQNKKSALVLSWNSVKGQIWTHLWIPFYDFLFHFNTIFCSKTNNDDVIDLWNFVFVIPSYSRSHNRKNIGHRKWPWTNFRKGKHLRHWETSFYSSVALTVLEKMIFKDLAFLQSFSLPFRKTLHSEFRNPVNRT